MQKKGPDYAPRKIDANLIRAVANWPAPDRPREILDSDQGLILRHQPSGYLALYAKLGRGKRERLCNAREIVDQSKPATFRKALSRARIIQGRSEAGEDFAALRAAARAVPTFGTFFEETYRDWIIENRRTGYATADRIEKQFLERFKNLKLDELAPSHVEGWKSRRRKDGVVPETINRDISALKAMLGHAVNPLSIIAENPLRGYALIKVDRNRKVVRAFSREEESALREALYARDADLRDKRERGNAHREARNIETLPSLDAVYPDALTPAVLISLGTGLRRGEQFALTWDRAIDFDRKLIVVQGETTKSYETREIPMNAEVASVLRTWQMQHGRPESGLVFPAASGAAMQNMKRSFYAVLDKAQIERLNAKGRLSWHSLRHTFGTRLGESGIDAETLRELMGHADLRTTQRYLHSAEDRKRSAVQLLAERSTSRPE